MVSRRRLIWSFWKLEVWFYSQQHHKWWLKNVSTATNGFDPFHTPNMLFNSHEMVMQSEYLRQIYDLLIWICCCQFTCREHPYRTCAFYVHCFQPTHSTEKNTIIDVSDKTNYSRMDQDHIPSNFLKAVFHKFYLVHSWILCPKYASAKCY